MTTLIDHLTPSDDTTPEEVRPAERSDESTPGESTPGDDSEIIGSRLGRIDPDIFTDQDGPENDLPDSKDHNEA